VNHIAQPDLANSRFKADPRGYRSSRRRGADREGATRRRGASERIAPEAVGVALWGNEPEVFRC